MVRQLYGSRSGRAVRDMNNSFGTRANLYTKFCSNPRESVRDHAKIRMFTRTIVIVIMGNVRVGTLSFNGIMHYVIPRELNHVKKAMGGA